MVDEAAERTYQWNQFVSDFYRDAVSKDYREPMTVAAILWQLVKASNRPKQYAHDLLSENLALIARYHK